MREKIFKKGIKKRLFSVVLALAMVVALLPMNSKKAYAADTSGDFGEGNCLHWELVGDTLTISGNGEMPEFDNPPTGVPWSGVGASIVNVVIESGVKSVGRYAFNLHSAFPNIASVTLPEGLERIGRLAFRGCENLTSISLPSSLKTIDEGAFIESGLTSIEIPKNISNLNGSSGNGIFEGCFNLTTVTFAEGFSYTNIPNYMFDGCGSLTSIAIPASVTSIGSGAFSRCGSLTNITIPGNVTSIGVGAFESCGNLTNITISENVASIEGMTFSNCSSLTNITIPASVTSIGDGVFSECSSLTNITIPASVTSIGDGVFSECRNLTFIKVDAITPPTMEWPEWWSLFYRAPSRFSKIYVPQASVAAYKAAAGWSQYEDKIEGFHDFTYSVTTTNTENDTIKATCGKPEICDLTTEDKSVSLTLTASSANYSGISGLDDFNTATGLTVSESDVEIYQVDAEGVITGGTLLTSAPTEDGYYYASLTVGDQTAVKAFTIETPAVHVTGVSLNKSATTLRVGATETLVATVTPDNATTKTVTWSSSDEAVATVDSNGKVTAVAAGTATITVKTTDENKTATCVVTVEADGDAGLVVPVLENPAAVVDDSVIDELKNKVAITAEEQEKIDAGQKLNISLEIVNNENITTESKTAIENKMVESLGADAKVGKFIDISLFKWFEGDDKEEGRLTNLGDKEIEIKMTVPDEIYAANRDYKVARNHNGKVDILGTYDKATKTITVKTGLFSDYAIVYTENEGPEYDYNANSIKLSSRLRLKASTNAVIEWTAVDGADAYEIYMNYCGKTNKCKLVKTVKAGTTKATITKLNKKAINQKKSVKAYVVAIKNIDGKKVRIGKSIGLHAVGSKVTKYTDAKKVTVDKTSVSLKKGKTSTIKATTVKVSPKKKILHSADEFRYASSNTKVAKVDKNGKIKGISKGSCYIYVYALNGCSKKIKVTVK